MKLLFTLVLTSSFAMAGLVNAIAFSVNQDPVTLYDIDRLASQQKMSKEQASIELLKQAVIRSVAETKKIKISKREVKKQIEQTRSKSNMDEKAFKQNLLIQGLTYDEYYQQIYMQKLQQKLVGTITYGKVSKPTKEEMKNFFEQNIKDFSLPSTIEATFYQSKNRASLVNIKRSPMFSPKDVTKTKEVIDPKKTNPKIVSLLVGTPANSYTQIIQLTAETFGMFKVISVSQLDVAKFEDVEKQVEQVLFSQRRSTFINNFLQDEMRKANVKYIKIEPLEL